MSEKSGIREASVSLEKKEATVSYNRNDITAERIARFVEEMGFDAFVEEVDGQALGTTVDTTVFGNNNATHREVPLQLNGGGDVKPAENQLAKCFLHITVSIESVPERCR